jgi:hypothetical protein
MRKRLASLCVLTMALGLFASTPLMPACTGSNGGPVGFSCSKVYTSREACGDTCIARNKICSTAGGCACNG